MNIIGVDVGGTFTDIIMLDTESGEYHVHKVPSTPESQDVAVIEGIEHILLSHGVDIDSTSLVVHGTTVATNAMLERKGSRVCLVTTKGLEDVIEIGRQDREEIYSLFATRPRPVVPRERRIGILERLDENGNILVSLSDSEVSRVQNVLDKIEPESIAISFLFSYKNPEHEQKLRNALEENTSAYVVTSAEVLPEFREYERTLSTVLEAYLGPKVLNYLEKLDRSISKLCPSAKLTIMQSNGGTMLCSQAHGNALGLAISGLAGGVIGGWAIADSHDIDRAITLDMGGTSCDISAIIRGVDVRPDSSVAGFSLRKPAVDVKTIGAGGGSIAWVDDSGILHVGPQSAGADPGPASYGKGGRDATVTDANLVLGRLNPDYFLGGDVKLDIELARESISRLADKVGLGTKETAIGIIRISTANMVQAIREVTVQRGHDPRESVLVPFGGAGPTQGVDIADQLGIRQVLVPAHPGVTSAYGLLCADLRVDLMQTVLVKETDNEAGNVIKSLNTLTDRATTMLFNQGANEERINIQWMVDMRYLGQSHELSIGIPMEVTDFIDESRRLFEDVHAQSYGYTLQDREIEWVTTRVVARSPQHRTRPQQIDMNSTPEPNSFRKVILMDSREQNTPVYRRNVLPPSFIIKGPSIIEQIDTTTYVAPGWWAEQQSDGTLKMWSDEN